MLANKLKDHRGRIKTPMSVSQKVEINGDTIRNSNQLFASMLQVLIWRERERKCILIWKWNGDLCTDFWVWWSGYGVDWAWWTGCGNPGMVSGIWNHGYGGLGMVARIKLNRNLTVLLNLKYKDGCLISCNFKIQITFTITRNKSPAFICLGRSNIFRDAAGLIRKYKMV